MCLRHAIILGGESGNIASEPVSTGGFGVLVSAVPRTNALGTRGGTYCLQYSGSTGDSYAYRSLSIPWEEFLVDYGFRKSGTYDQHAVLVRGPTGDRVLEFNVSADGKAGHYVGGTATTVAQGWGTLQDESDPAIFQQWVYRHISHHVRIASGTNGFMRTWVDTLKTPLLESTGIDTTANGETNCGQIYLVGERANCIDDIIIRPRCLRVDGVTGGSPTIGGAISTSGGPTAEVYAWESQTADSESGGGDAMLASGEIRLFLRNVSFDPVDTTGGWSDNDAITVPGLTGTLLVNAPAANFRMGLEPGGQLFGKQAFIERPAIDTTNAGTDDIAGTLVGGASSRRDALSSPVDGKKIDHTADNENVSCKVAALGDQGDILEIVSVIGYVRASSDGSSPDAVQVRLLDNGTEMLGPKTIVGSSQTTVHVNFDVDAAGGAWSAGTGAGGTDAMEPSYKTGTI